MRTYEETMKVVETIDLLNNKKDYYVNVWANNPDHLNEASSYALRRACRMINDISVLEKGVKTTIRALLKSKGWNSEAIDLLFKQNTIHALMKNWNKYWRC